MNEASETKSGSVLPGTQEATIRINMDGLESAKTEVTPADQPINRERLGVMQDNMISLLTPKPPEKYIFRKSIGRGGMKMVIQVKDRDTMRDIAMAVFPDAANRPEWETRRFIEEARITASLEHPNIVPVHDIGVDASGSPYFTMKLLRGETLASILKKLEADDPEYKEVYSLDSLLRIFIKVCNAVAFAHSKGVIHLDLKPENIQIGDFGEVLLMDFGLAKVISKSAEEPEDPRSLPPRQNFTAGITVDGVTKGTPGYMAPEQAAGRNSLKDFRTDIYALGAILYAIATCKNPLSDRSDMKQMMMDTVNGKIIPPRERTPERMIPSALEAVIMKAMSVAPENRYQSTESLRDEVRAFLGGFATKAEKAGLFKRMLLFVRRNKITFPAITVSIFLLLGISFYAMEESARQKSEWISTGTENFRFSAAASKNCTFFNSTLYSKVPAWQKTPEGLAMQNGEWIFFRNFNLNDGVKAELNLIPSKGCSFTIAFNTTISPLRYIWEYPEGYAVILAGYGGSLDLVIKNPSAGSGTIIGTGESGIIPDKLNKIVIERNHERLLLHVNGKKALDLTDLFPLPPDNQGAFGIRAEGRGSVLQSVKLHRLALPEKASPLIAGDILLARKHYEEAVEQYLSIAENYSAGPIPDAALAKAYSAAATFLKNNPERNRILANIKRKLAPVMKSYKYREQILTTDALTHWNDENYHLAMQAIDQLFLWNPRTEIMLKILQLPHRKLPPGIADSMLDNVAKNNRLTRLDLSGFGLTSLKKLKGMNLNYLDCSNNQLTSLEGLEKMPLESLDCSDNRISSLEPLQYIPLRYLSCSKNQISSMAPLNMNAMNSLNISYNKLDSLDSISGKNLEMLAIRGNQIRSLAPLHGMNLKTLDAGKNLFNTLTPLCGMPLETLFVDGSGISNLNPVKDMKLITLGLHNCKKLKDISPIFEMKSLQMLSLPPEPENVAPLQKLPALMFITDSGITPQGKHSETADVFWEDFHKEKKNNRSKD